MINTEWILKTSSAKMPSSCRGIYKKLAIMEVEKGYEPPSISLRHKQVKQIFKLWEPLFQGKTEKSEYFRYKKKAEELVAKLNAGVPKEFLI